MPVTIIVPPPWLRWTRKLPWKVGYFPPHPKARIPYQSSEVPGDLTGWKVINIGTKQRTLGDALMQSQLPEALKARYPGLKVRLFSRGLNPVVFANNPAVDGLIRFPKPLHGDDSMWGFGQHIQLKENFFGLPVTPSPKPKLFLTEGERVWAAEFLKKERERLGFQPKKTVILHPWGGTWPMVAARAFWQEVTQSAPRDTHFIQLGLQGQEVIEGCQSTLLADKEGSPWEARKGFALVQASDAFIGVNSGPMHVARAFEIPSLILTTQGPISKIFEYRKNFPYYLKMNVYGAFLYEENQHLEMDVLSAKEQRDRALEFLAAGR